MVDHPLLTRTVSLHIGQEFESEDILEWRRRNHLSAHGLWKAWPHGSIRRTSPSVYSSRQIAQQSRSGLLSGVWTEGSECLWREEFRSDADTETEGSLVVPTSLVAGAWRKVPKTPRESLGSMPGDEVARCGTCSFPGRCESEYCAEEENGCIASLYCNVPM